MIFDWIGSQQLSEIGAALVGIGSVLSVFVLFKDGEKKRVLPVSIILIAFGSVLTLAPEYEEAGRSAYWRVIAGLATLALAFAFLNMIGWLIRFWNQGTSHEDDDDQDDDQAKGPIGADVDAEQHPPTVGAGTLSGGKKSLASGVVAIAVGLVLAVQGVRIILKGK
jgi:hypothetical protein